MVETMKILYVDAPSNRIVRILTSIFDARVLFADGLEGVARHVPFSHINQSFVHFESVLRLAVNILSPVLCGLLELGADDAVKVARQVATHNWLTSFHRAHMIRCQNPDAKIFIVLFAPYRISFEFGKALNFGTLWRMPLWVSCLCRASAFAFYCFIIAKITMRFAKVLIRLIRNQLSIAGMRPIETLPPIPRVLWLAEVWANHNDDSRLGMATFFKAIWTDVPDVRANRELLIVADSHTVGRAAPPGGCRIVRSVDELAGFLNPRESSRVIWEIFSILTRGFGEFFKEPTASVLMSQIPKIILSGAVFRASKVDLVVYSQSCLGGDATMPIAAKRIGVKQALVFYSCNCEGFVYHGVESREYPALMIQIADYFLVWNSEFGNWMTDCLGYPQSSIINAGPIMFARARGSLGAKPEFTSDTDGGKINIGIFDVTPLALHKSAKLGFGDPCYNMPTATAFISDVIRVLTALDKNRFRLILKLKRPPLAGHHEDDYLAFLEDTLARSGISYWRYAPDANPWHVLNSCHTVIGLAFTSMVDAASAIGLPASFYWPRDEFKPSEHSTSPLLCGYDALNHWVSSTSERKLAIADLTVVEDTEKLLFSKVFNEMSR